MTTQCDDPDQYDNIDQISVWWLLIMTTTQYDDHLCSMMTLISMMGQVCRTTQYNDMGDYQI